MQCDTILHKPLCMQRQVLFAVSVARSGSAVCANIAEFTFSFKANIAEFTVLFKKIGPIKLWLDMATKAVTFPLWLLFPWKFPVGSIPQNRKFHLPTVPSKWKQTLSKNHMLKRISCSPAAQVGNWSRLTLSVSESLFTAAVLYGRFSNPWFKQTRQLWLSDQLLGNRNLPFYQNASIQAQWFIRLNAS